MKKGYYVITRYVDNNKNTNLGINKKIYAQMNEMQKNNLNIKLLERILPSSKIKKILYRIPLCNPYPRYFQDLTFYDIDFLYIRYVYSDSAFINFLKRVKKENPFIKIILEIPTYPYEKELDKNRFNYIIIKRDAFYRKKLKYYVDRIVTFSQDEFIFEIPTIQSHNGIDITAVQPRKLHLLGDTIHFIGVANLAYWHGYDRLIKSLFKYYKKKDAKNIIFHIIGPIYSEAVQYCETLVKQYDLADHVIFHGELHGADLDAIYDIADIGVESLGAHRKSVNISSSLKSREFIAKSLPFLASTKIDILPDDFPYYIRLSNNEDDIDIESIIEFANKYLTDTTSLAKMQLEMNEILQQKCDISITMKKTNQYLA